MSHGLMTSPPVNLFLAVRPCLSGWSIRRRNYYSLTVLLLLELKLYSFHLFHGFRFDFNGLKYGKTNIRFCIKFIVYIFNYSYLKIRYLIIKRILDLLSVNHCTHYRCLSLYINNNHYYSTCMNITEFNLHRKQPIYPQGTCSQYFLFTFYLIYKIPN